MPKILKSDGNVYAFFKGKKFIKLKKRICSCGKIDYVRKEQIIHNPNCFRCAQKIKGLGMKGNVNIGPSNGMWKGNDASRVAGQIRAQRLFKLKNCEICGGPAYDRHHKDSNTLNNNPLNVQILCRLCHMEIDGRLSKLRIRNRTKKIEKMLEM